MQDARAGSLIRALRIQRGWRQADLARAASVSASLVSEIERGDLGRRPLRTLRTVGAALGATIDLDVRWRGGDADRLLNAAHTQLAEAIARHLDRCPGWSYVPEAAFAIGAERGVIDLLAFHLATGSLLIIEVKTTLTDIPRLLEVTSRRLRLAPRIAAERGWSVRSVSSWIVVADSTANRRLARSVRSMLRATAPADGRAIRAYLSAPLGSISALSFWSNATVGGRTQRYAPCRRVRLRTSRPTTHAKPSSRA
jgi:transcriptional regulator with XRE-family HTH domain